MPTARRKPPTAYACMVLTTVATRAQAVGMAKTLLAERHCACVSILPAAQSLYRWQGRIQSAREQLLLLKTTRAGVVGLEKRIGELHPYEVPEILVFEASRVGAPYGRWLADSVGAEAEKPLTAGRKSGRG